MAHLLGYFAPGWMELMIVAAILLLLFGGRLPSVMRNLGRGVVEFKRGVQGVEEEIENADKEDDAKKNKEKDKEKEKESAEA